MKREPLAILGVIVAILVAVYQQLVAGGIITADTIDSITKVVTILAPLVTALAGRQTVYAPNTVEKMVTAVASAPQGQAPAVAAQVLADGPPKASAALDGGADDTDTL